MAVPMNLVINDACAKIDELREDLIKTAREAAEWRLEVKANEALIKELVEALMRIEEATPKSTNSVGADEMSSWTRAVAASALDRATVWP